MADPIEQLRKRTGELSDLGRVSGLLDWDQQTMMPPQGAAGRAEGRATLERIRHELFVSPETGRIARGRRGGAERDRPRLGRGEADLEHDAPAREGCPRPGGADRGDRPRGLARAGGVGPGARELGLRLVRAVPRAQRRAGAPLRRLLRRLRARLRRAARRFRARNEGRAGRGPVRRAEGRAGADDRDARRARRPRRRVGDRGQFPVDRQRRFVSETVRTMGFDPAGWRLDDAVHPFATSFGNRDVRITTRWDERSLVSSLYAGDARVRPRPVRGRDRGLAPAHAARPGRVAEHARVPEPDVGEHGRSRAPVLRRARAADRGAVLATPSRTSTRTRSTAPSTA